MTMKILLERSYDRKEGLHIFRCFKMDFRSYLIRQIKEHILSHVIFLHEQPVDFGPVYYNARY